MCNADAYFALGKSHTVCQDYAATGKVDGTVLAVVADGCSSSPDTDFGARFLVKTRLSDVGSPLAIVQAAGMAARVLGMPTSCLDATLLVAEVAGDTLTVVAYGDGVIDIKYVDGSHVTYSIEFQNELPAYLSYHLRPEDLKDYLVECGQRKVTVTVRDPDGVWVTEVNDRVTLGAYGYVKQFTWPLINRVTLCTDGVRSFRRVTALGATEAVPLDMVLAEVTGIKSPVGQFMCVGCGGSSTTTARSTAGTTTTTWGWRQF